MNYFREMIRYMFKEKKISHEHTGNSFSFTQYLPTTQIRKKTLKAG